MSITDELREWAARELAGWKMARERFDSLTAIADSIDAEHVAALKSLGMAQAERDEYLESCRLWEFKCGSMVELPRDADGETIHIGDELESVDNPSSHGEVHRIELTPDACWVFVNGFGRTSNHYRHYHAPTVEDVLREFTDAILEWSGKSGTVAETGTWSDVAAEFVAKLRLAEEETNEL